MKTTEIISLADWHLDQAMYSAAKFCLAEAERFSRQKKEAFARKYALLSLAYSVGLSHPDYILASK
jgi:hypothetical protein